MYERQAAACGATVVRVPAVEDSASDGAAALAHATQGARDREPDDPTGALAGRDDLLAVVRAAPRPPLV